MTASATPSREIIQDDGELFLVLSPHYPAAQAPGFLMRRCPDNGQDSKVVGGFQQDANGWHCDIHGLHETETDIVLATNASRIDAMVTLWRNRKLAQPHQAK